MECHVTEENCRTEIDSISRHGQLVPVLGRQLRGDSQHDIELIYGARRLFAARHINTPLLVELRELSDIQAIIAMDIENRQRTDISPYERGMSFSRWIRAGYFQSQDDIARALKISSSQVSRLLKLSRLPSVVVDAFASPLEICEGWGVDLVEALDDSKRRESTVRAARTIATLSPRPPAREVYRQLAAASASGRRPVAKAHDEVVKDDAGSPLFRIRYQSSAIAVLLPVKGVSARSLGLIRDSITDILQAAARHATNSAQLATGKARNVDAVIAVELP